MNNYRKKGEELRRRYKKAVIRDERVVQVSNQRNESVSNYVVGKEKNLELLSYHCRGENAREKKPLLSVDLKN